MHRGRLAQSQHTIRRLHAVARAEGARHRVGRRCQQAQVGGIALVGAGPEVYLGAGVFGEAGLVFGEFDFDFALAITRQRDHRLPGADDFAYISAHRFHYAVNIGLEHGVAHLIALDGRAALGGAKLRLRGRQLAAAAVKIGLGDIALVVQADKTLVFALGHIKAGTRGGQAGLAGQIGELVVARVDTHQLFALMHVLADLDMALDNLARHTETHARLHARLDVTGQVHGRAAARPVDGNQTHRAHRRRGRVGIIATGCQRGSAQGNQSGRQNSCMHLRVLFNALLAPSTACCKAGTSPCNPLRAIHLMADWRACRPSLFFCRSAPDKTTDHRFHQCIDKRLLTGCINPMRFQIPAELAGQQQETHHAHHHGMQAGLGQVGNLPCCLALGNQGINTGHVRVHVALADVLATLIVAIAFAEHETQHLGRLARQREGGAHGLAQGLHRVTCHILRVQHAHLAGKQGGKHAVSHLKPQIALGAEVVVQHAVAQPAFTGQLTHGKAIKTLPRKGLKGLAQDGLARQRLRIGTRTATTTAAQGECQGA